MGTAVQRQRRETGGRRRAELHRARPTGRPDHQPTTRLPDTQLPIHLVQEVLSYGTLPMSATYFTYWHLTYELMSTKGSLPYPTFTATFTLPTFTLPLPYLYLPRALLRHRYGPNPAQILDPQRWSGHCALRESTSICILHRTGPLSWGSLVATAWMQVGARMRQRMRQRMHHQMHQMRVA